MARPLATLTLGFGAYIAFLVTALDGISFTLGGVLRGVLRGVLPAPFDLPHPPLIPAFLVDVGLIALFGVQHSLMARAGWKRWWTSMGPPALERSLYVLLASALLLALFWLWRPIPTPIWEITNPLLRAGIWGVCLAGWALVVWTTFQFDHFELLGLRPVWRATHNRPPGAPEFRTPLLYRVVRHPMMSGFLLAFWATPVMSVDRLLFALGMSLYILIGLAFEEHTLRRAFGPVYEQYEAAVPRLIPLPMRRREGLL